MKPKRHLVLDVTETPVRVASFEVTLPSLAAQLEEYLREDAILKR